MPPAKGQLFPQDKPKQHRRTQSTRPAVRVTALSGDDVTISHGPVPDLEWPAMTMAFRASSADMLGGVAPGDQVSFSFRQADGGYVLTSLTKN